MIYKIRFKKSSRKELESLDGETQQRVVSAIESLALNPMPRGASKPKAPVPLWRIRVGSFRVLYEIQNDVLLVYVIKIAHRKDAYCNV